MNSTCCRESKRKQRQKRENYIKLKVNSALVRGRVLRHKTQRQLRLVSVVAGEVMSRKTRHVPHAKRSVTNVKMLDILLTSVRLGLNSVGQIPAVANIAVKAEAICVIT